MGKKKAFIDKKSAKSYKLVPSSNNQEQQGNEKFVPTKEHLEEQHKSGIYFDDDYDYMQHLRDVRTGFTLQSMNDDEEILESFIIRAPNQSSTESYDSGNITFFDNDLSKVLEGEFGDVEGDIDDNFIELAGGAMPDGVSMMYRAPRKDIFDSDEEEDEKEESDLEEYGFDEEENDEVEERPVRKGEQRDIDNAFDKLLEADYNDDQMGELDADDENVAGFLEPDDGRLKKLAAEIPKDPEYEEKLSKDYVRRRQALIEAGVIKETEEEEVVEVDECSSKRMKWDCESFASQYTNIYNHPTLIKDSLSRKALKRLERESAKLSIPEADNEEMDACSDDEVSTVSTFRPKGETAEQRKLRKQAVKEARRARRVEKKANKEAFAEEYRKVTKARVGQIKGVPIS